MDQATLASAEASLSLIQTRVSEGVVAAGGNPEAINWQALIQLLFQLFTTGGICPTPTPTPPKPAAEAAADIKATVEKHPLACQELLFRAYRKHGQAQPRQVAQGTIHGVKASTVEELTAMATTAQAMQAAVDGIPE